MFSQLSSSARFRVFLLTLCGISLVLILLTTAKYGAGVSSDAARNLSTADSLLAGRGFVDMVGAPFVLWPPLYPLVMVALSRLTGLGTFQAAWYLNVLLYAVNLYLAGWLLYRVFRGQPLVAGAGALILLLSRSTLRIYANISSEPLFETFLLLFLFAAARYIEEPRSRWLWAIFLLAGLATLQRYLGVVLFGVAVLAVFSRERWRGLLRTVPAALVGAAPIAGWALLHNIPISGAPFGPRDMGEMLPLQNISLALTKILWWFIPRLSFTDPLLLRPWTILLALAALLIVLNRCADWRAWAGRLSQPLVWPGLVFSVVYFFLLAFTVVTADHLDLTSDRYYVVILPVVLILLLITIDVLIVPHVRASRPTMAYALAALVALWFVYPVYGMQSYVGEALIKGEPTNYNIANSAQFREMKVVRAAEAMLANDPHATLYTNYVNVVWFIFRHPVRTMPFENQDLPRDQRISELHQYYPDWPPEPGYIIWFTPNQYHHIAAPDELATLAHLKLLYSDKTGQIYEVLPAK